MVDQLLDVSGKVVVITGGSGTIFREVGRGLAERGATVALLYHTHAAVQSLAEQIREDGGSAIAVECDVLDADSIQTMLARVIEGFGKVDALINGAGGNRAGATVSQGGAFADLPLDEIRKVFDLNCMLFYF